MEEEGGMEKRLVREKRAFIITEYPQLAKSRPTCCTSNRAIYMYIIPRDSANILRA